MTPARDLTKEQALDLLAPLGVHAKADGRVDLPATVEGVTFIYADAPRAALNVDPRFAVFLVRFAQFLHDTWDVTKIYHMGIWPAGYGQYSHDAGLAIDFAGVQTASGERFMVLQDWGSKPRVAGKPYRLTPDMRGYQLFKDIYEFTGIEGDDRCNGTQTVIGTEDSFIRHPDLHDATAAEKHRDHMHLQAGQVQTGKACSPPKASTQPVEEGMSSGPGTVIGVASLVALGFWFFGRK